jgi:hypothetical protein
MEIDSETITSPPSIVQRETNIISDEPIAPFDPVAPSNLVAIETYPETLQLDIKGLLRLDKLYKKQKCIKPHK